MPKITSEIHITEHKLKKVSPTSSVQRMISGKTPQIIKLTKVKATRQERMKKRMVNLVCVSVRVFTVAATQQLTFLSKEWVRYVRFGPKVG